MSDHLPQFTLERLAARDLSSNEQQRVDSHLSGCVTCRNALASLHTDQAKFEQEVPYAAFRVAHEQRRAARTPLRNRLMLWVPGLAMAAAAAVIVLPHLHNENGSAERSKGGGTALTFAVLEGGGLRQGTVGEELPAGSRLQLAYDAGPYLYMSLVGIDGRGEVNVYFPEGGSVMTSLPAGRVGPLPFSLTLDAAPGEERFMALFAREPLSLEPILAILRGSDGTAVHLPNQVAAATVWVRKASR